MFIPHFYKSSIEIDPFCLPIGHGTQHIKSIQYGNNEVPYQKQQSD